MSDNYILPGARQSGSGLGVVIAATNVGTDAEGRSILKPSQALTLADGADTTLGTTTDAPVADNTTVASATAATGIGLWKRLVNLGIAILAKQPGLGTAGTANANVLSVQGIASGTTLPVTASLAAGSNLAGKVGLDQTTPGTTNGVALVQIGATTTLTGGVNGSLGIGGLAATAAAVAGNPVLVGGFDGTNARNLRLTPSTGVANAGLIPALINPGATDAYSNGTRSFIDDTGNAGVTIVTGMLFNATTWDRPRNNTEATALASAARSSTTNSSDIVNYNSRGVIVYLNITVVPGTDTLTLSVTAKDPVSSTYVTLLTDAATAATGIRTVIIFPGAGNDADGINTCRSLALPRTFRVTVTHSAGTSFTYSVGYALIN